MESSKYASLIGSIQLKIAKLLLTPGLGEEKEEFLQVLVILLEKILSSSLSISEVTEELQKISKDFKKVSKDLTVSLDEKELDLNAPVFQVVEGCPHDWAAYVYERSGLGMNTYYSTHPISERPTRSYDTLRTCWVQYKDGEFLLNYGFDQVRMVIDGTTGGRGEALANYLSIPLSVSEFQRLDVFPNQVFYLSDGSDLLTAMRASSRRLKGSKDSTHMLPIMLKFSNVKREVKPEDVVFARILFDFFTTKRQQLLSSNADGGLDYLNVLSQGKCMSLQEVMDLSCVFQKTGFDFFVSVWQGKEGSPVIMERVDQTRWADSLGHHQGEKSVYVNSSSPTTKFSSDLCQEGLQLDIKYGFSSEENILSFYRHLWNLKTLRFNQEKIEQNMQEVLNYREFRMARKDRKPLTEQDKENLLRIADQKYQKNVLPFLQEKERVLAILEDTFQSLEELYFAKYGKELRRQEVFLESKQKR